MLLTLLCARVFSSQLWQLGLNLCSAEALQQGCWRMVRCFCCSGSGDSGGETLTSVASPMSHHMLPHLSEQVFLDGGGEG